MGILKKIFGKRIKTLTTHGDRDNEIQAEKPADKTTYNGYHITAPWINFSHADITEEEYEANAINFSLSVWSLPDGRRWLSVETVETCLFKIEHMYEKNGDNFETIGFIKAFRKHVENIRTGSVKEFRAKK